MKQAIMKRWVAALRSGDEQTNDSGASFKKLATFIERNWQNL